MKKIICKIEYDTDTMTLVNKTVVGKFGDEDGYEESLYQNAKGTYFLYTNGGAASKYPKEDLKRMTADKAKAYLAALNK